MNGHKLYGSALKPQSTIDYHRSPQISLISGLNAHRSL